MINIGENKNKDKNDILYKKSVARLISCQTIYTFFDENNQNQNVDEILKDINEYYVKETFKNKENKNSYSNLYKKNFTKNLINFVINNREEINNLIDSFLNKNETLETIDPMLLSILRVAIAEIKLFPTQEQNRLINEYVDITAEFFDNIYISFVNGILNNIVYGKDDSKIKGVKEIKEVVKVNKVSGRKILTIKK